MRSINQSWDPETPLYSTPLGSPTTTSKRSYVHVPGGQYTVFVPGTSMSTGAVYGPSTGIRVGNTGGYTGVLPGTHPPRAEVLPRTSDRRERALPAGEGGFEAGRTDPFACPSRCARQSPYPPSGPGRCPAGPSLVGGLAPRAKG